MIAVSPFAFLHLVSRWRHFVAGTGGGAFGRPGLLLRASSRLGRLGLGGPCVRCAAEPEPGLPLPDFFLLLLPLTAKETLERTSAKQSVRQVKRTNGSEVNRAAQNMAPDS